MINKILSTPEVIQKIHDKTMDISLREGIDLPEVFSNNVSLVLEHGRNPDLLFALSTSFWDQTLSEVVALKKAQTQGSPLPGELLIGPIEHLRSNVKEAIAKRAQLN